MSRIAVLTSGGDASGMNAAIRAVVRKALYENFEVVGIERGYAGLIHEEFKKLGSRQVGSIVTSGGTILKTARFPEFKDISVQKRAYEILQAHQIDHLVVIGGDGSMRGAHSLAQLGASTITIPSTIDNDMLGTDYTLGFDTCVNTIVGAVAKIRDSSSAHERVAVVEVMGNRSGHIALQAGLASGAEAVLVPEHPMPLADLSDRLVRNHKAGKTYSIVITAEGAYHAQDIATYIKEHTSLETAVTVLGYVQRGGVPTSTDAVMAAQMGSFAIDQLQAGISNALVGMRDGRMVVTAYEDCQNFKHTLDEAQYQLIDILSR